MCTRKPGKYEKKTVLHVASLKNKNNVGIAVKDTFFSRNKMFVFCTFFLFTVAANIALL